MTLVFDPFLANWALVVAAIIAAAIAGVSLVMSWKGGVFRAIAIAGLFALLLNPLIRVAEQTPLDDIVLILVDESASQSLDGRNVIAAQAAETVEAAISALGGVEPRVIAFDGAEETRTVAALKSAIADTPRARLGGVFIITDGQAADAQEASPPLGIEAPVHLLLTGRKAERDRKITLINAPRYGIVGQSVRVSFRIDDLGPDETIIENTAPAIVVLRINGEEVLRQPAPFGVEASFDTPLDRPGRTIVELEVASRDGELTTRNTIAVLPITAIRDRLRVLLISGEPHPGERVWRNLLKSDPAVDLVHFTILRPIDKNDGTPVSELALIQFPQNELFIDKLTQFDLLIFDRYTYRAVLDSFHFDNIARYVEQGGGILIAAGPEYNGARSLASRRNLSFILPAIPAGSAVERAYRPRITDLGKRHPVTDNLPEQGFWGRWLRIMQVTQLRGQTLLSGPDETPLLILDRVGKGRIGLLLSDHVWLWARGFDGGGPHAELLRRIAHWLMKEPELEEEALSLTGEGEALMIRRRTMDETAPAVAVTSPDGVQSDYALTETSPGLYEARIEKAPRGLYRARSGELFAVGAVGLEAATEFVDVVSNRKPLAPLTQASGGRVFSIRSSDKATPPSIRKVSGGAARGGADWAGVVARKAARIDNIKDKSLAPPLAWLVLIAAALLAGWLVEGGRFSRRTTIKGAPAATPDPTAGR